MFVEQQLKNDLKIFLCIVATLCILGLIFVYSASSFYALETYKQPLYFVKKHLIGIILGSIGLLITSRIPLQIFNHLSFFLFISSLMLTLVTLTPLGFKIHGAQRWISLPGIAFQPSELLKITLVIYLASFLSRKKLLEKNLIKTLMPFGCIIALCSVILLIQPDFGCMVTICTTTLIMLFIANLPLRYFIASIIAAIPCIFLLIYTQPYRWQRIITYLNPWQDPQGTGFQIIQALIATGSGGTWGTGIAQSKQKFLYLPMQHTDFIFAIIAEEIGFIGSLFLISLCILFLWFGFKISWQLQNSFSVYLVQGITTIISLQFIINLLVSTGLAPTKGIGFPFISYGNTALVCNIMAIGFIINAVQNDY